MDVLKRHWKDSVTQNVIINTLGNYLSVFLGALYTILLFRFFSPYDFGVLSILLTMSYLLANFLSFGVPAALYAHIPELLPDKKKVFDFLKTNFLFQSSLASISLLLIYLLVPRFDTMLFKLDLPNYYYGLTMISTLMFIWQNFIRDSLNAARKFFHINAVSNISNVVKIICILGLGMMGKMTIANALIILGIIGPFAMFLPVFLKRKWLIKTLISHTFERAHIKLSFTMTYFVSTQLFNLTTRADLFLVAFFLTPVDAGYYSVAQRVIFIIITSIDSITQVLSPEFAKVSSEKDIRSLVKKACQYMAIPSAALLSIFFIPDFIYKIVLSANYVPAIPLIKFLSLTYIPFSFDAALLLFFLYTLKKPSFVLYINILMLAMVSVFHLVFIPRFGLFGPVASFGIMYSVTTVIIFLSLFREMRLLKK